MCIGVPYTVGVMEHQGIQGYDDVKDEEIPNEFQCCVCLNIMYKPVVSACGHISCSGCVFKSMNTSREWRCPVCRNSYNHSPRTCNLFQTLLLKLHPSAYKRRRRQVEEEEKEYGDASQECVGYLNDFQFSEDSISPREVYTTPSPTTSSSHTVTDKANYAAENSNRVLLTDLQCAICKDLLCRPVVLNCGHVHCEACIDPHNSKCPVCQLAHPNGFPSVCLVLENFLEEHFPEEYSARKESLCNVQSDSHSGGSQCIKEILLFPTLKPESEPSTNEDCYEYISSSQNNHLSSPCSSFRIAIVGDIHEDWKLEDDSRALHFLHPDLVMFTGDFGNENVELVKGVAKLNFPKVAILGNHDAWCTSKFSKKTKDGVQVQLECLGEAHVGYGRLDFPPLNLSVVGGRPFSCGGNQVFRKKLLTPRYGVRNMEESAERIYKAALGTPEVHSIIILAHNGPTGLGSNVDDICGMDWACEGGDHGDPDLAKAISQLKETTKHRIPLVVFGHMHKELACGGPRKMIAFDADSIMYLNAAVVPRVKYLSSGGSTRAFSVVEFSDGKITKVTETWVSIIDDKASLQEELLLFSSN